MVLERVCEGAGALVHAVAAVALVKVCIQRGAGAVEGCRLCQRQVQLGKGIHVRRRAVLREGDHARTQLRHCLQIGVQLLGGALDVKLLNERGGVQSDARAGFAGRLRGKARDARADGLVQLAAGFGKTLFDLLCRRRLGIELALGRRIGVGQAGKHLAHAGDVLTDVARRVQDAPVCAAQNDVGMAAHDFHDQRARDGVAHLAERLNLDFQNAVAGHAAHGLHAARGEMLAQQHAEHGRLHRAGLGVLAQVDARGVGRGAEHQTMVRALRADEQVNLVPLGLDDAVHASVPEFLIELARDKAEHHAVHGHMKNLLG